MGRAPSQRLPSGAPVLHVARGSLHLASGSERLDMRRLPLSEGTVYDPSVWLSGSATDGGDGSGISATIIGGVSTTDPLTGVYIVWPLVDGAGRQLSAAGRHLVVPYQVNLRTAPGDTTDTELAFGLINEATDSATVDGVFQTLRFTGGSRALRSNRLANGAATSAAGSGANVSLSGFASAFVVTATDGIAGGFAPYTGLTSAEAAIIGSTSGDGARSAVGTGRLWACLSIYRTATTAGNITIAADVYVGTPDIPAGLTA